MRRTVSLLAATALLLGAFVASAQAAKPEKIKPLVVVASAGCDAFRADVAFIGELTEKPYIATMLDGGVMMMTKGKGLVGIDKSRPWGLVLYPGDKEPDGFALVPVTELAPLLRLVNSMGPKVSKESDGVWKIETKKKPLYVTEKDGWAVVADSTEELAAAPNKPGALLDGLNEDYDLAARLYFRNATPQCREKLARCMREHAKRCFERHPAKCEEQQELREKIAQRISRHILAAVDDLDEVTLGWSMDEEAKKAVLEMTVTAEEGTKVAECMAGLNDLKTNFGGFRMKNAAVTCGMTGKHLVTDPELIDNMCKAWKTKVFSRIDAKVKDEAKAKVLKEFVGGMVEVANETKKTGKIDGAMSITLKPNAVTMIGGRYVADADKLEATFGKLVQAAKKKHPEKIEKILTPNAETHEGVRLHKVSIEIPDKCPVADKARKLVGKNWEMVMGIGPHAVYFAAGKRADVRLKKAITKSNALKDKKVLPLQGSLDLGEMATFAASVAKGPCKENAEKAVKILEENPAGDKITLVARPIKRGVRWTLEVEPAALEVMAKVRPHGHKWGSHGHKDQGKCPAEKKGCPVKDSPAKKCPTKECPAKKGCDKATSEAKEK